MSQVLEASSRVASSEAALPPKPDFEAVKTRQHGAWSSGDYCVIGTTLQIVGESLCEAVDLRAGESVLDVAAGNGNASLAAARRGCSVTSTDYVQALLDRGRERADAERLGILFREADAEALPFPDASFDVVLSTFGVMFTPNQERAAAEMIRVCKPGGRIGLASWTPDGFIGQLFKTIGRYVQPAPGMKSPALWGTRARLAELFGEAASGIDSNERRFVMRYRSPEHWLDVFRTFYGPVLKTYAALSPAEQDSLTEDILALIARFNRPGETTAMISSEYLEAVITRA